ncbi:MAG TPA: outer membrane protein transport protein [Gemmatimonadaceae bacterium]|jgi:long-chain fatty acid transport protein
MRPFPSFLTRARWLAAVAVCLPATILSAQGFGLNEVGTCAVSRGFAVTGSPCADASTIFWNPGAAADLEGKSISIGASDIAVRGTFRQDTTGRSYDSNIRPTVVPAGFAAMRIGKASLGIGVYVPYGLTSQWHDNFPGRFSAVRASLQTIYVQPNIAFQANDNWSIGGGPVFGHSTVDLKQALDLSQQFAEPGVTFGMLGIASETEFARARFHGTASAVGYNVGVHGKFGDWSIGARFLSQLTFNYRNADATFVQVPTNLTLPVNNPINPATAVPIDAILAPQFAAGGPLVSQKGASRIVHPWQMQGGFGYNGFEGTKLSVDLARIGWSAFQTLPVTFTGPAASDSRSLLENYDDSWSYRFGAEHQFHSWVGRAGYSYANSPAPDVTVTPLLPDMNRRNFSAGVEIPVASMYKLDVGYLHVNTPGRRGRIIERTSASQDVSQLNTGAYTLSADVFSAALNIKF